MSEKLSKAIHEKSQLIEAVNFKQKLPMPFQKDSIRRKMSAVYAKEMQGLQPVSKGRMRLPSIVSTKGLPALPDSEPESQMNGNINKKKKKSKKRKANRKRKKTKGWFRMSEAPAHMYTQSPKYDPRVSYDHRVFGQRGRGISNNKLEMQGARPRLDTPSMPTVLLMATKHSMELGPQMGLRLMQKVRKEEKVKQKSLKSSKKKSKKSSDPSKKFKNNRSVYSPPDMGIVQSIDISVQNLNVQQNIQTSNSATPSGTTPFDDWD